MRNQLTKLNFILATIAVGLLFYACGSDDKDDSPSVTYATMVVSGAPAETENTSYDMTKKITCTNNADSGLFEAKFAVGDSKPSLNIKIKGFQTSSTTYTCTQATDNTTSTTGQKYDSCAIIFQTFSDSSGAKLNTYSTYRDTTTVDDFTYTGTCTIATTYSAPRVTGTITCTDLFQTHFEDVLRNPIEEPYKTADIATGTEFYCDL